MFGVDGTLTKANPCTFHLSSKVSGLKLKGSEIFFTFGEEYLKNS